MQENVIERLAAPARRVDEDAQVGADLALADELLEALRTQAGLREVALARLGRDGARGFLGRLARTAAHRASSFSAPAISASARASPPSRAATRSTAATASGRL